MKAILRVFRDEFWRIFALRPVLSVLVVGSVFYADFIRSLTPTKPRAKSERIESIGIPIGLAF